MHVVLFSAIIILHEGQANIGHSACVSSCKILAAARAILDLLHKAYSTSHNLATLGIFPMVRAHWDDVVFLLIDMTGLLVRCGACAHPLPPLCNRGTERRAHQHSEDRARFHPVRACNAPLDYPLNRPALSYSSVIGGIGDSLPHACAFVQNVFVLRKIGY